jgi:hypothetical protein
VVQTKQENLQPESNNVIANCDIIVFGSYLQDNIMRMVMTYLITKNSHKAIPTECGYKFNVVLFDKPKPKEEEIDMFTAILGDPKAYVERMGNAGYHGMVVKQKTSKTREIIATLKNVLTTYGFEDKLVRKVIKATVV